MNKQQEDAIIAQANRILQRRSLNTIYFEETGGGGGETNISIYIILPNGKKASYDYEGELVEFSRTSFKSVSFKANELPKELLFSFRHGVDDVFVDSKLENYKWCFNDLKYDKVNEKEWKNEQKNLKTARKKIDACKNIDDIWTLYDKHLRNIPIPHDIISKAFNIIGYNENISSLFNGEIGCFAYERTFAFLSLMESYKKQ